jgi:hypothetical protein
MTVVIQGGSGEPPEAVQVDENEILEEIRKSRRTSRSQAVRDVARRLGISRKDAYRLWIKK